VDEVVFKQYRRLIKTGFQHAGILDNPSIVLDSVGEGARPCGRRSDNVKIFIHVNDGRIDSIKYLCSCDPAANVAIEILCDIADGKTLGEVAALTEDSFFQVAGSRSEELGTNVKSLMELIDKSLMKLKTSTPRDE
jgi:NifU-like protein involved in Fe-S cluster formation